MVVLFSEREKVVDWHLAFHYCRLHFLLFLLIFCRFLWFLSSQWLWRWIFLSFLLTFCFRGLFLFGWLRLHWCFCFLLSLWLWLSGHLHFIDTYTGLCCDSGWLSSGWDLNSGFLLFFDGSDGGFGLVFLVFFFDFNDGGGCFDFFGANRFAFFEFIGLVFLFEELGFGWFVGLGSAIDFISFFFGFLSSGFHEG